MISDKEQIRQIHEMMLLKDQLIDAYSKEVGFLRIAASRELLKKSTVATKADALGLANEQSEKRKIIMKEILRYRTGDPL